MHRTSARMTAAAAALLVASTMGLSTAAYAADQTTVGGQEQALTANPALVNPDAKVQLSIHKYLAPTTGQVNNGTILKPAPTNPPVEGVVFDIYKVQLKGDDGAFTDVDLKTNAGWEAAAAVKGAKVTDVTKEFTSGGKTFKLVALPSVTTNDQGLATFTQAGGVGLYFGHENLEKSQGAKAGGEVVGPKLLQAEDFFVTLPMTDPDDRASWMYDVHVYPKNAKKEDNHKAVKDGNTTTAEQSSVKVGDVLTYEVSTNVPNYGDVVGPLVNGAFTAPDGKKDHNDLTSFYVDDYFTDNLEKVAVKSVVLGTETLKEDTDYKVLTAVGNKNNVRVYLTETGLDKAAASEGASFLVSYTATVKSVPDTGLIKNEAYTVPGDKPNQGDTPNTPPATPPNTPPDTPPDTPPTPPTNTVVSKFGKIRISKIASDTNKPLDGATFEVHRAKLTYGADGKKIEGSSCAPADLKDSPVLATLETKDGGKGESGWLQVSNWYNDGVEKAAGGSNDGHLDGGEYAAKYGNLPYCLVETKAPTGYQLLAEPIRFELTEVGATKDMTYTFAPIKNQPDNLGNKLPLTGGEGVALFSVAGLALIGGGLGYYTWTQRRRKDA